MDWSIAKGVVGLLVFVVGLCFYASAFNTRLSIDEGVTRTVLGTLGALAGGLFAAFNFFYPAG